MFNEKHDSVVVPTDSVARGAVQVVRDDRVRRVEVTSTELAGTPPAYRPAIVVMKTAGMSQSA